MLLLFGVPYSVLSDVLRLHAGPLMLKCYPFLSCLVSGTYILSNMTHNYSTF